MIKEKTVFVVHGRNKQARDSMFSFLRSLKLEPLEWSQAVALTGQPSPFIYDVVKVGIENSQCVIVLFTGDDMARLRSEYGNEPVSYQPRPNVIFEAGWAFSRGGQEKTIIVTFGNIREFTDISGINFISLTNTPTSRKNLVERLKIAKCQLDDSGTDFLRPEVSGDFEIKIFDIAPDKTTLDRGEFTDFIVDSSLSHTLNNLDLYTELCDYLSSGDKIDLKFNYLGTLCASNWLALSEDPTYGHSELKDIIKSNASEIVQSCQLNNNSEVDFISLGPGDGKIDKNLIHQLQKHTKFRNYYPLDLSFELLQQASSEIVQAKYLKSPFKIKAIHGDFTELIRYKPIYGYDQSINFFSLVGYSLGNHDEAELLGKIREGMQLSDYLLLDARIHQIDGLKVGPKIKKEDKETVLNNYYHDLNNRFAFGPVETATLADFKTTEFLYDVNSNVTAVPNAINIITYCKNLTTKFRHNYKTLKRTRLNLALTTLYSFDALAEWLETRAFQIVLKKKVKSTGIFVLKKIEE